MGFNFTLPNWKGGYNFFKEIVPPIGAGTLATTAYAAHEQQKNLYHQRVIRTEKAIANKHISIEDYVHMQTENGVSAEALTRKVKYQYSNLSKEQKALYPQFDLQKNETVITYEKTPFFQPSKIKIVKGELHSDQSFPSGSYGSITNSYINLPNQNRVYTVAVAPHLSERSSINRDYSSFEWSPVSVFFLYTGCLAYLYVGAAFTRKIFTGSFFEVPPLQITEIVTAYKKGELSFNQASFLLIKNHNMPKITSSKILKNEIPEYDLNFN